MNYFLNLSYLAFPFVGFIGVYYETIARLIKGWFTYQNSHGMLIMGMSLYMIWIKRRQFSQLPMQSNILAGLSLTILGCLMHLAGKLSCTVRLQDISLIITLMGLVWLLWGSYYLKILWFPIAYLILMFPFFTELLEFIGDDLQSVTAWIAYILLKVVGIPVLLDGQYIALPHITLEVGRACSGINHIIVMMAMAVPLIYMNERNWLRKGVVILIAFLIGVFSNGLRVSLIGIWAICYKGASLHGPFDILYVSFVFFFGLALFMLIKFVRRKRHPDLQESSPILPKLRLRNVSFSRRPLNISGKPAIPKTLYRSYFLSAIVALIILVTTSGFLLFYKPRPVYLEKPLTMFPNHIGHWSELDVTGKDQIFKNLSADYELRKVYGNPSGQRIELYIGYFAMQDQDKKIVGDRFDWLHYKAEIISIHLGRDVIEVKKRMLPEKNVQTTFYFWYDINRRIVVNRYLAKLFNILDAFTKRRNKAAIVIISRNIQTRDGDVESDDTKFIQAVLPIIRDHLNGT